MENKQIIEINGIKMEVDLREAKRVDTFRVGDKVKLLKKKYSDWEVYAATIVGFDQFQNLPTIIVAYVEYSGLNFCYINAQSKDIEICMANEDDIPLQKEEILSRMDSEIDKAHSTVLELKEKKQRFIKLFGQYMSNEERAALNVQ